MKQHILKYITRQNRYSFLERLTQVGKLSEFEQEKLMIRKNEANSKSLEKNSRSNLGIVSNINIFNGIKEKQRKCGNYKKNLYLSKETCFLTLKLNCLDKIFSVITLVKKFCLAF